MPLVHLCAAILTLHAWVISCPERFATMVECVMVLNEGDAGVATFCSVGWPEWGWNGKR